MTNFAQLMGLVDFENPKSWSIVGNLIMTILMKVMMMMHGGDVGGDDENNDVDNGGSDDDDVEKC